MIISLHLPKTAGSSFRKSLEDHFGERFVPDYRDTLPFQQKYRKRIKAIASQTKSRFLLPPENIKCVHGHFLAFKYLHLVQKHNAALITWVRHPIDRLLSNYSFIHQQHLENKGAEFFQNIVREQWSFERFALAPQLRNIYNQYLWRTPYQNLGFIGITEYYDDDFDYFCDRFLNTELSTCKVNVTRTKKSNRLDISAALQRKIEDFHSKDMELYELAIQLRNKRSFF